jgi:hypothetical protein
MENKGKDKENEKIICKAVWDDLKMTEFFVNLWLRISMRAIDL